MWGVFFHYLHTFLSADENFVYDTEHQKYKGQGKVMINDQWSSAPKYGKHWTEPSPLFPLMKASPYLFFSWPFTYSCSKSVRCKQHNTHTDRAHARAHTHTHTHKHTRRREHYSRTSPFYMLTQFSKGTPLFLSYYRYISRTHLSLLHRNVHVPIQTR